MRRQPPRLLHAICGIALLGACAGPDPDLVRRLEERIEHLENRARIQEESYERQVADLQKQVDELGAENAALRETVDTLRTVSGSTHGVERQLGMLEQQLDACHRTADRYRADLDRCLAGGSPARGAGN